MNIKWNQALLAGLVGTLLFDIVGFFFLKEWWDIPALLSMKFGAPLIVGVLGHYGNGVMLAVIYSAIAPLLKGPRWARALTFMTAQTIGGVWLFMLPLLDMGIAGLSVSAMIPVITMARHWAFGAALIAFIEVRANSAKPLFGTEADVSSLASGKA